MGNSLSTSSSSSNRLTVGTNSNLLAEVGNDVQYDRSMGSSRFLKAIRARHLNGPIVVKTFLKSDPGISLRNLVRRLRAEREALADIPNVLTYQKVIETERAGYLLRQWLASNLYDRISTRPFLTNIEKKWITYQLLYAMKESRKKKVSHGDLKCENILVTSSLTIYITDFAASFKPTFLPLDDPADFSFFYDTSGRRTCYVAPERFFEADSEIGRRKNNIKIGIENDITSKSSPNGNGGAGDSGSKAKQSTPSSEDTYSDILGLNNKKEGKVSESMDVFSLGCVIAELWRDGSPIFTLSQLFKFREGLYDPELFLNEIDDVGIRELIKVMISLDPKKRSNFNDLIQSDTFPKCFGGFLHEYLMDLQKVKKSGDGFGFGSNTHQTSHSTVNTNTNTSINNPSVSGFGTTSGGMAGPIGNNSSTSPGNGTILRTESDERIERLYEEWSIVIQNLNESNSSVDFSNQLFQEVLGDVELNESISGRREESEEFLPVQLCIPGLKSQSLEENSKKVLEDGNSLIILSVILSNLRNCKRPSSKLHAMDLLLHLSASYLTDETKLDRVTPFFITLLSDESMLVRSSSIRNLTQILMLVKFITPSNSTIITEYILPNIIHLRSDISPTVRSFYCLSLIHIARIGERFLQMSQAMGSDGIFLTEQNHNHSSSSSSISFSGDFFSNSPEEINDSYDYQLKILQNLIQDQVTKILTEDNDSTVKRTLLENVSPLIKFFGLNGTNDILISHMITNLNDKNWLLRESFFHSIVEIALNSGKRSLEEYILPLMLQALTDSEEFIILKVIKGLNKLLISDSFSKERILNLLEILVGYSCHPNFWIRESITEFIGNSIQFLDEFFIWSILYPSLRPLLKNEVEELNQLKLLENLKTPLERNLFVASINWANKVSNKNYSNGFWKPPEGSKGKEGLGNHLGKEGIGLMIGKGFNELNRVVIHRSEEDDAYLDKLRGLGMNRDDEVKLVALRDYIWKLARQNPSQGNALIEATEDSLPTSASRISSGLEVQTLEGITPQTIFFSSKSSDSRGFNNSISEGVSVTQSLRSYQDGSFSGRMAKRRLTGIRLASEGNILSPLEELRRRMASNSETFRKSQFVSATSNNKDTDSVNDSSSRTTPIPRATSPLSSQGRLGIKAAPIITSQRANAIGTMTDLSSKSRSRDGGLGNLDSGLTTPIRSDSPTIRGEDQANGYLESGPSFSSTYDGNDPYIRAHLEAVYLSSYRDRAPELGPKIAFANNRKRMIGMNSRSSFNRGGNSNKKPEGNLIAYFNEHSSSITSITVSPDHLFFVSGSEDGTIKIWDTMHLEKNVTSKSRASYNGQKGSIVNLLCLENSHCVASCSNNGSLHIWRIEISQSNQNSSILKYNGKPKLVSNFQLSTPGEFATCLIQTSGSFSSSNSSSGNHSSATSSSSGNSSLILGTTHSRITILDLRTMQVLLTLQNPIHFGSITCLCTDKKRIWLLVGTNNGILSLWDLRFHLLLKSWRVGTGNDEDLNQDENEKNGGNNEMIKINKISLHPGKGRGRWVLVTFEKASLLFGDDDENQEISDEKKNDRKTKFKTTCLVETWDIDKGICVETFQVGSFPKFNSNGKDQNRNQVNDERISETVTSTPNPISSSPNGNSTLQSCNKNHLEDENSDLGDPAAAIERLVRLHEDQLKNKSKEKENENHRREREDEDEEEDTSISVDDSITIKLSSSRSKSSSSYFNSNFRPSQSSVSNVKAMFVGVEGYSSSAVNSDSVPGGWLDAGKLAKENSNSTSGNGPAGYMITGGEDRKIRFWDLGKTEKSICLGLIDERSEFRSFSSTNSNPNQRHIHHLQTPTSSKLFQIRSPLINHKQSQYANSLMKSHKDSITALAVIESPFRCIVAGDASGCIRVWE